MSYFRASRKANVYQVQIGDKGQGLAPQATSFFIASGRGGWNHYRTRTFAPKRDFIFCMNRLGGVGVGRSQYKIRGLNHPDGARRCRPYRFQHRHRREESYIEILFRDILAARGSDENTELALLGKHPFLRDVIDGLVRLMEEKLYFRKQQGNKVLVHLEGLATLVERTSELGFEEELVGQIVMDAAGRLRGFGNDPSRGGHSGVMSLKNLKVVMENSRCPVFRAVVNRMNEFKFSESFLSLPTGVPTVADIDLQAYFPSIPISE